ncbi:LOW QUALITY PROTEIN: hypothetical protein U0070_005592 [Myodes glareolus]|uniref:40S ribosomal protein S12 n=1 Tax=Myodes glareolus TaxID=447135 RepID=A0AAW0ILF5_MYOGA
MTTWHTHVAKALDKCQAHLCALASSVDEPVCAESVETLCANLSKVDDKKLGEQIDLCKSDREGKSREVVGCSWVAVRDDGSLQLRATAASAWCTRHTYWNMLPGLHTFMASDSSAQVLKLHAPPAHPLSDGHTHHAQSPSHC